jgi:hypothetical protein
MTCFTLDNLPKVKVDHIRPGHHDKINQIEQIESSKVHCPDPPPLNRRGVVKRTLSISLFFQVFSCWVLPCPTPTLWLSFEGKVDGPIAEWPTRWRFFVSHSMADTRGGRAARRCLGWPAERQSFYLLADCCSLLAGLLLLAVLPKFILDLLASPPPQVASDQKKRKKRESKLKE